jgi:hypothetical protein
LQSDHQAKLDAGTATLSDRARMTAANAAYSARVAGRSLYGTPKQATGEHDKAVTANADVSGEHNEEGHANADGTPKPATGEHIEEEPAHVPSISTLASTLGSIGSSSGSGSGFGSGFGS